jgi:hypothetical protein
MQRSVRFYFTTVTAILAGVLIICLYPRGHSAESGPAYWPDGTTETTAWTGRLRRIDEHLAIISVRGTPDERGTAHGKLLKSEVGALVGSVREFLSREGNDHYRQCVDGGRVMRKFVDKDVVTELDACAKAAGVDSDELMLTQLFGDVNRAKGFSSLCSSFAAFGEATVDGKLIFGRNFDYGGRGLEGGLPVILQEIPTGDGAGRPFVTLGYAGILNGWTAMNADGLCASNNTLFNGSDSLEGMSTCFLLRKIVERATTVEQGVSLVEKTPRACTTGMMIAGKNDAGKWDARFVEFDSKSMAVVEPRNGLVLATNQRQKLPIENIQTSGEVTCGRYKALRAYITDRAGKLSFDDATQNPAAAQHVYMSINLHCALLDPPGQRFRAAFVNGDGKPAAETPFRSFRVSANDVSVEEVKR